MQSKAWKKLFSEPSGKRRDEQFKELYPSLQRYCQFISQNKWDGEDLVQESLLKAWNHYQNHTELSPALLNTIARNEWIDNVRRRSKELLEEVPDHSYNGAKEIEDRFEVIQELLAVLTPKQTIMFVLKEGFQFQNTEIAALLNTTETAVKAIIYRAKQSIKKNDKNDNNPLIEQYWNSEEREQIEKLLQKAFANQDPSILIKKIPTIRSLTKETNPTCSVKKSLFFKAPSSTVSMAA
ncbi:sigma-70 family RNA polymerase sigma factor [Fredinandcohnia sp. 179-A 10B2 NHS]|uniref:sigma-70 family RNA polymerase sigma factor n=1 Tax=Fredinandcohnia sp. 179-A 10B2 NHS TaxID=3235176 RepID=UPI0039A172D7